ncbi:hypothetical protein [Marinobacter psychrophilus]|jgi:hypothetical protein|uniref:hypothetical protein n=1 Tax=Marinobacter psychrophilus TaxID=330734 RepID=UPI001B60CE69|nr:hypothetical protein [Marinobacter psychrophilus]MBQ0761530.1 hypothetical protein [Marinobacter psychrophilus]MBQ0843538.1 hypothetical protein [Marinobacter psychrophilus]
MSRADTLSTTDNLRPADQVMQLDRLGSMFASRLSFARSLVRKMIKERWQISNTLFDLNDQGHGTAIYRITTPQGLYHCVIFCRELRAEQRSDRVIAEAWDATFAIVEGDVEAELLQNMADNVPLQEAGRLSSRVLVLSRANKSLRNFSQFVAALAVGEQPDPAALTAVGYLYRTTAVYGNGKFGIADFARLERNTDLNRPFSAQMLAVYVLRQFSIEQLNHLARVQAPDTAAELAPELQRYLGIGNSTGLGMAPFLINHPQLIQQWIYGRERALACARLQPASDKCRNKLLALMLRAHRYLQQTVTEDQAQTQRNRNIVQSVQEVIDWLEHTPAHPALYRELTDWADEHSSVEAQELINTLLIEMYPELVDSLDDELGCHETMDLQPDMKVRKLKELIEQSFGWALNYSEESAEDNYWFWYRSAEKEEPRLGIRAEESGAEKETALAIGPRISRCYTLLAEFVQNNPGAMVVEFLMAHPKQKEIVRRIQTMAPTPYGEIRANLWHRDMKPMHLLRTKLSFFGAGRFDPKSDRWVRITLFQGAPLGVELTNTALSLDQLDDWSFPIQPERQHGKQAEAP